MRRKTSMDPSHLHARILIVDDDEGLLRLVEKALRREGFETRTAATGRGALDCAAREPPNLMLVDLKLQDMDGAEVIGRLERTGSPPPFVVMTGQGDERVAVEMMKRGALDYVVKDTQLLEVLPTVVGRALERVRRDRKLADTEAALQREHAFTSAVLDTAGALVVVLDREARVVRLNRAFETVTGYRLAEAVGRPFFELFVPREERAQVAGVFENLRQGSGHSDHENSIHSRDGGRRLVRWSNAVLRDAQGRVEFVIGTGIDITETRALERQVLQAGEAERRRIGQDLHDGICQQLAGVELMSQVLQQNLERQQRKEAAQAATIAAGVRQAMAETRMLARGLSPVPVEREGLMAALKELTDATTARFGVECRFRCERPVSIESTDVALHLFRIAQEAVNNAVKHARPKSIDVALTETSHQLALTVRDNGKGLPPRGCPGGGMGLGIMEYRAGLLGGSLLVQREPQGGTSVVCTLRKPGAGGQETVMI